MSLPLIRKLPYNHPYRYDGTSFGGPKLWTPSDISTVAWYDAYDESTITEAGGAVSQWDDKSGNAQHLVQGTGANQPTTNIRTINGLNVLDNSLNQEFMENTSFSIPSSGDLSIFIVAEIDSVSSTFDSLYSMDSAGNNDFQLQSNNATQFDGNLNVNGIGSDIILTGGPFIGPSIFNTYFDYTGTSLYGVYVDGDSKGYSSYTGNKLDILQTFRVFTNRSSIYEPNGAFGEVIVVEDCSDATRQKIESYLAHKWGLEENLIDDHPYKLNPPVSYGTLPQYYTPWNLPTLGWYDASDESTITYLSSSVSQWDDKKGNGDNLSQGSASSQPSTGTRTLNGLNVIDFDSVDDFMFDSQSHGDNILIVGVWDIDTSGLPLISGSGSDQAWIISDNLITLQNESDITLSGSPYTGARIVAVEFHFDLSTIEGYIDGELKGSGAYTQKAGSSPLRLMTNYVSSTKGDGAVAEVLVMERHQEGDREIAEGYLAHKWGLITNLPSNHPYKVNKPQIQ